MFDRCLCCCVGVKSVYVYKASQKSLLCFKAKICKVNTLFSVETPNYRFASVVTFVITSEDI